MASKSILYRKYPEATSSDERERVEKESISETLSVFEDKSQLADTLISEVKSGFKSLFLGGIQNLIFSGELTGEDMERIASDIPINIGANLGGGYGFNLGLNVPSEVGKQDFRVKLTKDFEEGGQVSGIDWNFISALEGGSQAEGYIPTKDDKVIGKSGLTIGTGWDVSQMSLEELESSGLPSKLIENVKPFVGLKGKEAQSKLKELGAPTLKDDEASIIDAFTHEKTLSQISKNYEKSSGESFEDLSPAQQTVLASVGFQYGAQGLMAKEDPKTGKEVPTNFWKQVTSGDWEGAQKNLMNYGDIYGTRREKEAELLEAETIAAKLAEQADEEGK